MNPIRIRYKMFVKSRSYYIEKEILSPPIACQVDARASSADEELKTLQGMW